MSDWWKRVTLGGTGLSVSRVGLGSSYGIGRTDVEYAFERGLNFFMWGTSRRPGFGKGVKAVCAKDREGAVVALQTYSRSRLLVKPFLCRGLKSLGLEYADLLILSWWNAVPPQRIRDAAQRLVDEGLVRHIAVSCHERPTFRSFVEDPFYEAIWVRYNAAHAGAEADVFPHLRDTGTGVVGYTGTRWASLLDPSKMPPGEPTPRASDCYRFQLSSPFVHACISGPADRSQLDEAMCALDRGPLDDDEQAWMRRVGAYVRAGAKKRPMERIDDAAGARHHT